ncbi:M14 family metallopeptidase [Algibacter mikhailovii]|uniref:Peptidase M14 n=1 Tax=Algibacter mikhailovii TaxID=425498 RepID=A0A918QRV6_9FLAO|nr:M14 metallopeptidase family protein [Algibacter mikhailovii]GGZ69086.1 peptidase M14 [Algibacter mikhailovii]
MQIDDTRRLFLKYKEEHLYGRYITHKDIEPLLKKFNKNIDIDIIGYSVLDHPIYGLKIGTGKKRILMWSQMHGNESTTTKAVFDLLNTLADSEAVVKHILEACTLYIIPILNPDGALGYTRINANQVDLNRDAQNLTQPESKVLKSIFETFNPDFCYNLHGQRTIFSAGKTNNSATVSFLAPAQDEACTITNTRKIAMEVIAQMNKALQSIIPEQVGVYDDAFNLNCVGDNFQSNNVPTILFEAGHYKNDYEREITRELIYIAYVESLLYISSQEVTGRHYKDYFDIPENGKCFLDVIIRNGKVDDKLLDIGIQYQEKLENGELKFIPKVVEMGRLNELYGHKEIEAHEAEVFGENGEELTEGYENVFVILNNEKILL